MSHRMAILARTAGVIGMAVGVLTAWAPWALALPSDDVVRAVAPGLLLDEPLLWLGLSLVLSPTLARLLTPHGSGTRLRSSEESAAYVNCPECEQLVRVGVERCPYCGEPLVGPQARATS